MLFFDFSTGMGCW